jgi:sec-independent protein translocase protein TatB
MNLGFPEMLFIFVLALIIFGPKKLPEIGRQIGKGLAEFKRASNEFQAQIQDEVRKLELEADLKKTISPLSLENTVSYSPPTPPEAVATATETASAETAIPESGTAPDGTTNADSATHPNGTPGIENRANA